MTKASDKAEEKAAEAEAQKKDEGAKAEVVAQAEKAATTQRAAEDAAGVVKPRSDIENRKAEQDALQADFLKSRNFDYVAPPQKSEAEMAKEREIARNTPVKRGA